jgi:hypothetical protein
LNRDLLDGALVELVGPRAGGAAQEGLFRAVQTIGSAVLNRSEQH